MPPEESLPAAWRQLARRLAPVLTTAARIEVSTAVTILGVLAAITLLAIETPIAVSARGIPLGLAFGLVLVHVAALPLSVRVPWAASLVSVPAAMALMLLGNDNAPWPWWPVLIVTQSLILLLTGLSASMPAAMTAWVVSVVPTTVSTSLLGRGGADAVVANLVIFVSISGASTLLGLALTRFRQLSDQLLTERRASADEYSRRVLAEDRARIARELHDVVAHSMSIINIQASTARYRHPALDDEAVAEFDEIASSSRQALGEMRGLLGILRPDDVGGELSPQPGLADIPELVAQAQRAGMRVSLQMTVPGEVEDVSELVGLTAYRVVQEALTNALRHAPGAPVDVACSRHGLALVVTIRNPTALLGRSAKGTGLGLVGMRERAASVGGTLEAGPGDDGSFSVRAILPLRGDVRAELPADARGGSRPDVRGGSA
jgi:signal transduction histidine kinase